MSNSIPAGHVGALTPSEQKSLQQFWARLMELCGTKPKDETSTNVDDLTAKAAASSGGQTADDNDKYGQTEEFLQFVSKEPPSEIRSVLWTMIKGDNPDSLLLRFLRARKWDVEKAVVMLVSTIKWRKETQIDSEIVRGGEKCALSASPTADEEGFMLQYRSGKSYVRGLDKDRRPVYIVKPKLHNPRTQSNKAMEMYILHTIESIRVLVKDPFDTACLIFDLTGFGLRNMDFPAVQFIVQVFEARYPETLGLVLVHNAPWVFKGIWSIVKGWLDPVVASKIHFTRNGKDLAEFIDEAALQTEYGGGDTWTYKYVEPVEGENNLMLDEETKGKLVDAREEVIRDYERATAEWAEVEDTTSEEAKEKDARREELAGLLQQKYWQLDPYVRSRNFYDRTGILNEKGEVNFAPGS